MQSFALNPFWHHALGITLMVSFFVGASLLVVSLLLRSKWRDIQALEPYLLHVI